MPSYQIHVQVDGTWQHIMSFEAQDNSQAFKRAMVDLSPAHYQRPIRMEQVGGPAKIITPTGDHLPDRSRQ